MTARRVVVLRFLPRIVHHASLHCQSCSLFKLLGSPSDIGGFLWDQESNSSTQPRAAATQMNHINRYRVMALSKFLDPKNDFAFKRIFGTEKNQDILIDFINAVVGFSKDERIQTVSFLKTSQDPEIAYKKQSLIDVLCTDQYGRQYIIEMQVARTTGFEKRAQYYAAKAYARQLQQGDGYEKLRAIIFVAITDFVMFPEKKAYQSNHHVLDKETYPHDLKDFSFTFLELPKFQKTIDELDNIVERWAYFFKYAEETKEQDIERIAGQDFAIARAYEELNRFSWTDVELNTYESEEKRERDERAVLSAKLEDAKAAGIEEGKAAGIKQGLQQGQYKIAKSMLSDKMQMEIISKYTGLTIEELKKLKAELGLTNITNKG